MRTRITFAICLCLLFAGRASAQWVVSDPGNLAQGIINASKNIIHTSKTAANMVNNFQETVKIYEQGKKYYDALKSVNNLVKDARKVQQTILMVGDITDIYVTSFQKMLRDDNFTVEELGAIAFGYTKLLEESNDVLTELKNVVNITTLSMTDKERMDVVERCHSKMKRYRNLVSYYTNKNTTFSRLARSLATIYIFARVCILDTLVPFYVTGNFLLHKKGRTHELMYSASLVLLYFIRFYHRSDFPSRWFRPAFCPRP